MNDTSNIPRRILLEAHQIVDKLPAMLTSRKLTPAFSNFFLTSYGKMILFIAVLDTTKIGDHTSYIHPDLLHQLGTDLGGRKVYLSNSTGLRFVIPLSTLPKLPKSIELPGDISAGGVALGVRLGGQVIFIPWSRLGHLLIAGMTGSGKSSLLRSIAIQALRNDIQLALADIDQTTFSMLDGHPLLFGSIATTPPAALELIQKVLGECDHRAALYKAMPGFPENIDEYNVLAVKANKEPLQRIILMLDESPSVIQALGGGSGEMASTLAQLGWRGRKFGVNFVFGAQDISKELIGSIREQVNLSIAFRIKSSSAIMAKKIGCSNAHRIPANRPGLAIADRFGPMQSYYVPKPMFLAAGASARDALSELEEKLFTRAWVESEGKLMFHLLGSLGEFYSDNLSKETHKGKYERAKQGYHNGWVPWGYKSEAVENRKLATPDPDLVPVVRQTYERYATGLYYDQEMANWLNSQGYRTRFGRLFTKDAMRDILQNPFYKGDVYYRGQYARGGKVRRRTEAEAVKGLHSPIIDEALFEKCQKVRAARRRQQNSNQVARRVYLLSGILTCKHCGRRLRAQSSPYNRYYREASRFGGVDCAFAGKSVRADEIETEISKLMESLVLPENWQSTLQEILNGQKDEIDPNKEKARLRGEMRRMREGYKRGLYEGDEHTFWREIESLQMQLNSIEQLTPHEVRQAGLVLANLQNAWRSATPDERQEFCSIILEKIVYDFESRKIGTIQPKSEYDVLFKMANDLVGKDGIHDQ